MKERKKEEKHNQDDVKLVTITENLCKAGEEFSGRSLKSVG